MKRLFLILIFFAASISLFLILYRDFTIMMISRRLKADNHLHTALNYFHFTRATILFGKYGIAPIYDHSTGPLERGFGYCDQQSNFFVMLCEYGGIKARMLMLQCTETLSCHTLAEAYINQQWSLFDLTYGIYFFKSPDSSQFITKSELNQAILDSVFNGLYHPEYYTRGHTESISNLRKIRIMITRILYPIWYPFRLPIQDFYLFLTGLNLSKIDKQYLCARHHFLFQRNDLAILEYRTMIEQDTLDSRRDRNFYQLADVYHTIHQNDSAEAWLKKLTQQIPTSTFKSDAFYRLSQLTSDSSTKQLYLMNANNWDSHWALYRHFRNMNLSNGEQK